MNSQSSQSSLHWLVLIVSIVISTTYLVRYTPLLLNGQAVFAEDFAVFYHAAAELSGGMLHEIYQYDEHPFVNPPYFLIAVAPLAQFSFEGALIFWYTLQLMLWIWVLFLPSTRKLWPYLSSNPNIPYPLTCFAISLPFVINTVLSGQTALLSASLLLWGIGLLQTRPQLAGIIWALLAYKIQFIILPFFVLLFYKNKQGLCTFMFTGIVLFILSITFFGVESWLAFQQASVTHAQVILEGLPDKYLKQMVSIYANMAMLGLPQTLGWILQFAGMVASILVIRTLVKRDHYQATMAMLSIGLFFCSAYILTYDTLALCIPILLLLNHSYVRPLTTPYRLVLIAVGPLALTTVILQQYHIPWSLLMLSLLALTSWKWLR